MRTGSIGYASDARRSSRDARAVAPRPAAARSTPRARPRVASARQPGHLLRERGEHRREVARRRRRERRVGRDARRRCRRRGPPRRRRTRPNPSRKSSGVPTTTTRSASVNADAAGPGEGVRVVGRDHAPSHVVDEGREHPGLDERAPRRPRRRPSRRRPRASAPVAARRRASPTTAATASGSGASPATWAAPPRPAPATAALGPQASSGHVDERRSSMGRASGAQRGVELGDHRVGGGRRAPRRLVTGATIGTWSSSWSEPWPHRSTGRAAADHEHRRAVHPRARDRAHAVGDARPGRERGDAHPARDLGPALGRERGASARAGCRPGATPSTLQPS